MAFGFSTEGTIVTKIEEESPSKNSTLEVGDTIFKINDEDVSMEADICDVFSALTGNSIILQVNRTGEWTFIFEKRMLSLFMIIIFVF